MTGEHCLLTDSAKIGSLYIDEASSKGYYFVSRVDFMLQDLYSFVNLCVVIGKCTKVN